MDYWSEEQKDVLDSVKLELDMTEENVDSPTVQDYAADVVSRLCRQYFGIEYAPGGAPPVVGAWEFVAKCLICDSYVSFPDEVKRDEWGRMHRDSTGHNIRLLADTGTVP